MFTIPQAKEHHRNSNRIFLYRSCDSSIATIVDTERRIWREGYLLSECARGFIDVGGGVSQVLSFLGFSFQLHSWRRDTRESSMFGNNTEHQFFRRLGLWDSEGSPGRLDTWSQVQDITEMSTLGFPRVRMRSSMLC
jgi:hypothetical protein